MVTKLWQLIVNLMNFVFQLFARLIPLALLVVGAAFITWAAWDVSPSLGRLVLGLAFVVAGRNLAMTSGAETND